MNTGRSRSPESRDLEPVGHSIDLKELRSKNPKQGCGNIIREELSQLLMLFLDFAMDNAQPPVKHFKGLSSGTLRVQHA